MRKLEALTATDRPVPTRNGAPAVLGDVALRVPRLTQRMTAAHGALLLRSRGRVLTRWFGTPILILETIGRRTGKPRATPLVYLPYRDDLVVVPANAGADRPPAWWLNLQALGPSANGCGIVILTRAAAGVPLRDRTDDRRLIAERPLAA